MQWYNRDMSFNGFINLIGHYLIKSFIDYAIAGYLIEEYFSVAITVIDSKSATFATLILNFVFLLFLRENQYEAIHCETCNDNASCVPWISRAQIWSKNCHPRWRAS